MSEKTANITFRNWRVEVEAIRRAAKRANKNLSEYCREVIVPWAYSELGEPRPNLPPIERGRAKNMIEEAAKRSGMTPREFERWAAEKAAAGQLGLELPGEPVRPRSFPSPKPPKKRRAAS